MKIRLLIVISIFCIISCRRESKLHIDLSKTTENSFNDTTIIYKIGVAAMLSPKEALPAYEEMIKYIGKKLNISTDMLFTKNYEAMNNMVKSKEVLAAFVCSGPYVKAHDKWKMELLAAPALHGQTNYYSYIIVNKKKHYKNLFELKEKKFAFTDPESNTGKLVPTYKLAKINTTPEEFFSEVSYTGSHDKSIEAVANNLVDGAAVDNLIWEYMNAHDSTYTSKTKIIDKIGPFCTPPVVTYPCCDSIVKRNIREVLLKMHEDPEGSAILNKLLIDKFVLVEDECYASVRNMQEWIDENKK